LEPLEKLIALDPGNRDALGMLADAELSQNLFAEAAGRYRQLTAIDSADPRAWYGLGKAYESLATHTFDRLNKSAPESPYVAVLLADTRLERRQYRSAFFFYKQAQSKLPDLPGIHAGLARVYRATDHAEWGSEEEKREGTLPAPDCKAQESECDFLARRFLHATQAATASASPAALYWATKAYNELGAEAFDRLGKLPESIQIHAFRAQALRGHNRNLEAVAEWQAALKLAPEDAKVKRELAAAVFDAQDYPAAVPLLDEALRLEPHAPDLNYMLGASLWHMEQAEKGLPYLESASQAGGAGAVADGVIGLVLVSMNRNAEAIPHLKKALALDDDGSLHYSLARAYQAAGKSQLAAEAMRQYQEIQKQNQEINGQVAKEAEITAPGP
jgi:tetratricopeptide (TPR) repeat protein